MGSESRGTVLTVPVLDLLTPLARTRARLE